MDRPDLSRLPRIDALVDAGAELVRRYGREAVTAALREVVDRAREKLRAGHDEMPTTEALLDAAEAELDGRRPRPLRRVLNATGVVVHTNLGRAPLGDEAVAALIEAAGASDLEFDLATGRRGSRGSRIDPLIAEACAAADGLAVNNAAGALVLILATLARGQGVVVSRGELVEIGGSFRIPDILEASGARLVEVGTTNRTRAADYAAALESGGVALVLKVHPSNYRISGFTEQVSVEELAALVRPHGAPLVFDVGSGLLGSRDEAWLRDEPSMRGALSAGADLAVCSGDKLLGGPQAGLVAGRADLVDACRRHPLARALRLDKLRIAALAATLDAHLRGAAAQAVPVWRMLSAEPAALRDRAERRADALGARAEGVEAPAVSGGGAA
ncbi:MAG: L-seryl-tRNA(Sec) selenium transferase, partial [Acidimicrobiia bacterium]